MDFLDDLDIPKYKKKSKKKTPTKLNHKHEWEDVILKFYNQYNSLSKEKGFEGGYKYCQGKRCKICGCLRASPINFTDYINSSFEGNPDLPVYTVKNIFGNNLEEEK